MYKKRIIKMIRTFFPIVKRSHFIAYVKKYIRQTSSTSQKRFYPFTKILLIILVCTVCAIILLWDSTFLGQAGDISCYHEPGNLLTELAPDEPAFGSSIFFHETSCQKTCYDIHLRPRQACSVESALLAHPKKDVFLLVSSPVMVPLVHTENNLIQRLMGYPNFKVRHISFSKYLFNTPLTIIDQSGALNTSRWPVSHASDILRYATLYKFGGIYLDLDVLVLKPFGSLINFAGAESNYSVGSGILGFGSDAVGREVAVDCAEELTRTFNGQNWGFNGPGVITRVLKRRCHTSSVLSMSKATCQGFDVHPVESFTAISYGDVEQFFTEDKKQSVPKLLNQSYTIHFWNKFSSSYRIDSRLNIPFLNYARIYCPRIYNTVNGSF